MNACRIVLGIIWFACCRFPASSSFSTLGRHYDKHVTDEGMQGFFWDLLISVLFFLQSMPLLQVRLTSLVSIAAVVIGPRMVSSWAKVLPVYRRLGWALGMNQTHNTDSAILIRA